MLSHFDYYYFISILISIPKLIYTHTHTTTTFFYFYFIFSFLFSLPCKVSVDKKIKNVNYRIHFRSTQTVKDAKKLPHSQELD